jgi:hypothetical protein
MTDEGKYGLVMKFLDGSESFAHGYEMGMLHMRMAAGELIERQSVHRANKEQIEMLARSGIASQHNYDLQWEPWDDDWMILTAMPLGEDGGKKRELRVIQGGLA